MFSSKEKAPRKFEDYNKEATETLGTEQEWSTEGAQLTLQKQMQDAQGGPMSCTTAIIQSLSLVNPQQSNYSFAISNQFRKGQMLGRIDSGGAIVGIVSSTFNGIDSFIQWSKRGPMPPDMFASAEYNPDHESATALKFLKGAEVSLQYFKSFGKRFGMGTELKYVMPMRKTISQWNFRWKSQDKLTVLTGEVSTTQDFKIALARKLQPMSTMVAELEHKKEQGNFNFRVGSQVNFVGQGSIRVQVDPEMRVKAMITTPLGRGNILLQFLCHWDPKAKMFRQGLDIKLQGAVPVMPGE